MPPLLRFRRAERLYGSWMDTTATMLANAAAHRTDDAVKRLRYHLGGLASVGDRDLAYGPKVKTWSAALTLGLRQPPSLGIPDLKECGGSCTYTGQIGCRSFEQRRVGSVGDDESRHAEYDDAAEPPSESRPPSFIVVILDPVLLRVLSGLFRHTPDVTSGERLFVDLLGFGNVGWLRLPARRSRRSVSQHGRDGGALDVRGAPRVSRRILRVCFRLPKARARHAEAKILLLEEGKWWCMSKMPSGEAQVMDRGRPHLHRPAICP